jgi:magnesium-transporting ATPase (P-type)
LLAENVNECIEDFRDAGMQVWMLTGDNGVTAREVGISSGILKQTEKGTALVELSEDTIKPEQGSEIVELSEDIGDQKLKKVCKELA